MTGDGEMAPEVERQESGRPGGTAPEGPRPDVPVGEDVVPEPRPTVAWEVLDGEAVLYEEDSGTVHLLDRVGTLVWSCFDGLADVATIVDDLVDAFGADRDRIEADVTALVADLGVRGLLVGLEPDEAPTGRDVTDQDVTDQDVTGEDVA